MSLSGTTGCHDRVQRQKDSMGMPPFPPLLSSKTGICISPADIVGIVPCPRPAGKGQVGRI